MYKWLKAVTHNASDSVTSHGNCVLININELPWHNKIRVIFLPQEWISINAVLMPWTYYQNKGSYQSGKVQIANLKQNNYKEYVKALHL